MFERHMLCDEHGMFPEDFNSWGSEVVKSELARTGAVAWSEDRTAAAVIVDPHGIQFSDAMPKLRVLAQNAKRFGDQYRRIEAVAKIDDKFRVLDLKEVATRASVSAATSIKASYESAGASDHVP